MRTMAKEIFPTILAVFLTLGSAFSASATTMSADTPVTTAKGNPFTAPAEWKLTVQGDATIVEAPEGGSRIVIVDVTADNAEEAVEEAWAAYKENEWSLKTDRSPIGGPGFKLEPDQFAEPPVAARL